MNPFITSIIASAAGSIVGCILASKARSVGVSRPMLLGWLYAAAFAGLLALMIVVPAGCAVVSNDRVFPKATWYWSAEAKQQRREHAMEAEWAKEYQRTNHVK